MAVYTYDLEPLFAWSVVALVSFVSGKLLPLTPVLRIGMLASTPPWVGGIIAGLLKPSDGWVVLVSAAIALPVFVAVYSGCAALGKRA